MIAHGVLSSQFDQLHRGCPCGAKLSSRWHRSIGLERALHLAAAELHHREWCSAASRQRRLRTGADRGQRGPRQDWARLHPRDRDPDALSMPIDQVLLEAVTGYLVEHVRAPRRGYPISRSVCGPIGVVTLRPTLLRLRPWRRRVLQPQDEERDSVDLMNALRPIMPPGFIPEELSRQNSGLPPMHESGSPVWRRARAPRPHLRSLDRVIFKKERLTIVKRRPRSRKTIQKGP